MKKALNNFLTSTKKPDFVGGGLFPMTDGSVGGTAASTDIKRSPRNNVRDQEI
jgi:hypothetical protein